MVKELDEKELKDRYREDYIPSKNKCDNVKLLIQLS